MQESLIRRILIVDDEIGCRETVQEFLRSAGYYCRTASNAVEALDILTMEPFDLVVSDIVMEGHSGLDLLCEALKILPRLEFIMMTGYSPDYSYCDIISAGASDFITKPFSIEEIKAKVERIERERRALKSLHDTNERLEQHRHNLEEMVKERTVQLSTANERLQCEVAERREMEDALQKAHDQLEVNVRERTAELAEANEQLSREIEERKKIERELRESERFLQSSLDALSAHVVILDESGTIISVNKAWRDFADANGYQGTDYGRGTNYLAVCENASGDSSGEALAVARGIRKIISFAEDNFHLEYPCAPPAQERWFDVRVTRFSGKGPVRVVVVHEDITERKRIEQQLIHDAFHDSLTGLPNRALFQDRLERAMAYSKRYPSYLFAVLFMDLDHFKLVNDSLGHVAGDMLLTEVAHRTRGCVRSCDTLARLGGDEFAILLDGIKGHSQAVLLAERIQTELSKPFDLNGVEVFTTVSVGIALSESSSDQPENLLRDADTAVYRAKAMGRARHEMFDREMHAQVVKRLQLETDLRKALERDEFRVYYQPVVSLMTGRIDGFEALVRWRHPERGIICPGEFISLAEETGIIVPIGLWVLRKACTQTHWWHSNYPDCHPLAVSVNLSARQLRQPDLVTRIKQVLEDTGIEPSSLKLEITESVIMDKAESTVNLLSKLKALGIRLSIDDFGTGYSSLSYLHRFPVDTLKIDRSFVSKMPAGNGNYTIVRTVVWLAHSLGLNVVAEGPETAEQVALLRDLGCEHGQGHFFSKPVDAVKATELIAAGGSFAKLLASLG